MRIAILGAGAMGMLFGGYLSKDHEVVLVDTDREKVDAINREGIRIQEPGGGMFTASPKAMLPSGGNGETDLVILFVKAVDSRSALQSGSRMIGPDTYVLSLQNGSGHETVMKEFVDPERIVIGTTQHNSSIVSPGVVRHGGGGKTYLGAVDGSGQGLQPIEEAFNRCGIDTEISGNIRKRVWEKLFVNVSASALSAILQTKLGFLIRSEHAWGLVRQLIHEAVAVANAEGMGFDEEKITAEVHGLLERARDAHASIFSDIRDGRKTEVDTISGAVVAAGRRNRVPAPSHEWVVRLIHALEDKGFSEP